MTFSSVQAAGHEGGLSAAPMQKRKAAHAQASEAKRRGTRGRRLVRNRDTGDVEMRPGTPELGAPPSPRSRRLAKKTTKTPATTGQRDARRLALATRRRLRDAPTPTPMTSKAGRASRVRLDWREGPDSTAVLSSLLKALSDGVKGSPARTLVLVHSPGCGFCKMLRPDWDAAAEQLTADGVANAVEIESRVLNLAPDVPLARAVSNGMQGVPHIVLFSPGSPSPKVYDGNRSSKSMIEFASFNPS